MKRRVARQADHGDSNNKGRTCANSGQHQGLHHVFEEKAGRRDGRPRYKPDVFRSRKFFRGRVIRERRDTSPRATKTAVSYPELDETLPFLMDHRGDDLSNNFRSVDAKRFLVSAREARPVARYSFELGTREWNLRLEDLPSFPDSSAGRAQV